MIEQVNSLIRNKLCQNESIYMPRIGSLIFAHIPAKRLSAKRIATPHNAITFSKEKRGVSLTDIIAEIAAIPAERADSIYEQWRQQTSKDDTIEIGGVGIIRHGLFIPDAEFASKLNLSPKIEVVKVYPRTNYLFYAIATLSILFAIGSAYYIIESEQNFSQRMNKESVTQRDLSNNKEKSSTEAQTRITATVYTEPREEVKTESAATPTATPTETPKTLPTEETLTPIDMEPNASYAVWGVYSEVANAIKYAKMLSEHHGELSVRIYNYKERYMVAVATSATRRELATIVAELKASDKKFGEVWIYTNR